MAGSYILDGLEGNFLSSPRTEPMEKSIPEIIYEFYESNLDAVDPTPDRLDKWITEHFAHTSRELYLRKLLEQYASEIQRVSRKPKEEASSILWETFPEFMRYVIGGTNDDSGASGMKSNRTGEKWQLIESVNRMNVTIARDCTLCSIAARYTDGSNDVERGSDGAVDSSGVTRLNEESSVGDADGGDAGGSPRTCASSAVAYLRGGSSGEWPPQLTSPSVVSLPDAAGELPLSTAVSCPGGAARESPQHITSPSAVSQPDAAGELDQQHLSTAVACPREGSAGESPQHQASPSSVPLPHSAGELNQQHLSTKVACPRGPSAGESPQHQSTPYVVLLPDGAGELKKHTASVSPGEAAIGWFARTLPPALPALRPAPGCSNHKQHPAQAVPAIMYPSSTHAMKDLHTCADATGTPGKRQVSVISGAEEPQPSPPKKAYLEVRQGHWCVFCQRLQSSICRHLISCVNHCGQETATPEAAEAKTLLSTFVSEDATERKKMMDTVRNIGDFLHFTKNASDLPAGKLLCTKCRRRYMSSQHAQHVKKCWAPEKPILTGIYAIHQRITPKHVFERCGITFVTVKPDSSATNK